MSNLHNVVLNLEIDIMQLSAEELAWLTNLLLVIGRRPDLQPAAASAAQGGKLEDQKS